MSSFRLVDGGGFETLESGSCVWTNGRSSQGTFQVHASRGRSTGWKWSISDAGMTLAQVEAAAKSAERSARCG